MDQTRQEAPTVDGIRFDHVARYQLAAGIIPPGKRVLDIACGVGYGSWIMHQSDLQVTGVDISQKAIDYAERHYKGPTYLCQKAEDTKGSWNAIISFETIEHLKNPEVIFESVQASYLLASVPNEELFKFKPERFKGDEYPHLRHYTPKEFEDFINVVGYTVLEKYCQPDKGGKIIPGTDGMFLIYLARK